MDGGALVGGSTGVTDMGPATVVPGAVTGGVALGGKAVDVVTGVASSSSCGFSSSEISTLAGDSTGWFCTAIICAIHRGAISTGCGERGRGHQDIFTSSHTREEDETREVCGLKPHR